MRPQCGSTYIPRSVHSIYPPTHTSNEVYQIWSTRQSDTRSYIGTLPPCLVRMDLAKTQNTRADRNYDIGFSHACRKKLALEGMLPPTQQSLEIQEKRCIKQIRGKKTEIARYIYLSHLRCQNNRLFYSLLLHHMKVSSSGILNRVIRPADPRLQELTPYVYTPVVGEACQRWSDIYSEPEGLA